MYIYIYIYIYIYVYIYTYIYIYICMYMLFLRSLSALAPRRSIHGSDQSAIRFRSSFPLQDLFSLLGFCARINQLFIAPPTCIAHTVAILLQYYCAIFEPLPTPSPYAIHHTISCMAISCKG